MRKGLGGNDHSRGINSLGYEMSEINQEGQ